MIEDKMVGWDHCLNGHEFEQIPGDSGGHGSLVQFMGSESWTIKKAEWGRTDAFELWCWRRLLRVPWTARRSTSQS